VKTQISAAISVYIFVAIIKKRLSVEAPLHPILPIPRATLFEKIPIDQLLMMRLHNTSTTETLTG
jgi:hypothetical protein